MLVRQEGYGSRDFWAAPGKVRDSNETLISIGSGVHLIESSDTLGVSTQDNRRKTLFKVIPINRNSNICTDNMSLWADCGRAARQIIGGENGTRGVYKGLDSRGRNPSWKKTIISEPEVMKWKILEDMLRAHERELGQNLLDERKITELKNQQNTSRLANYFLRVYSQLTPKTRDMLDRRTGINRWADPQVGQAYTISSGGPDVPGVENTWNFHWAGVVMKSDDGRDNVTLENYSVGIPDAQNNRWIFQIYGSARSAEENPAKRGQTFHEEHRGMGTHGQKPTTMVGEGID